MDKLTCPHCGSTEDVIKRHEYVGGQNYILVTGCRNQTECWKRWDEQHGLKEEKE